MAFFLNAKQLKYCECKNKHRQEEGRATGSAICTGGGVTKRTNVNKRCCVQNNGRLTNFKMYVKATYAACHIKK